MKIVQVVAAIAGVTLGGLGVSMALTNPSRDAYEEYAAAQLSAYLKQEVCTQAPQQLQDILPSELGNSLESECKTLVDTVRPQMKAIVGRSTERQNFIVFSIYRTNLSVGLLVPNYEFETLAIFDQFIIYQAQKQ
ncbi:DUF4359 domain-containing protein [Oscillatoria salina]|uniref:DUF4359 domain-containing protein n=1 Tax=Oscillatoria salina TaxID=331517 RepID=UPI0013BC5A5F|nr:DUF4359 domain-containing protein [Oscillatoria salina]MBZ8182776.1 DUF4359 domain-containing protein [Oscillatoria salina IIICB1]NET91408.1 DUF4359 domain-containing protein [Kamptonema sp. SIO1D9]